VEKAIACPRAAWVRRRVAPRRLRPVMRVSRRVDVAVEVGESLLDERRGRLVAKEVLEHGLGSAVEVLERRGRPLQDSGDHRARRLRAFLCGARRPRRRRAGRSCGSRRALRALRARDGSRKRPQPRRALRSALPRGAARSLTSATSLPAPPGAPTRGSRYPGSPERKPGLGPHRGCDTTSRRGGNMLALRIEEVEQ